MPDRQELLNFENLADAEADRLGIWTLPLRSLLSTLFLSADSLFVGHRLTRDAQPRAVHGASLLSRLSYVSSKLRRCGLEVGRGIDDALSVIGEAEAASIKQLQGYTHFCVLMPEVHRGIYSVSRDGNGFRLRHTSDDVRRGEELDVLFTEFSLAFDRRPIQIDRAALDRITKTRKLDFRQIISFLRNLHRQYQEIIAESPFLREDKYPTAFGFTRNEFGAVRSALFAFSDFGLGMADVNERRWNMNASERKREALAYECMEWAAPCLKSSFLLGTIQSLSGLDADVVDRVLDFFTMDAVNHRFDLAGDGYLPPLVRLPGAYMFSPHALKIMMPERNLLYVTNVRDGQRFGELVANGLEESLLDEAEQALRRIPGWVIARNVVWERGEIDLLVFDPQERSAIHLQAKAAIPPQGARMTRQVETRAIEAAEQIARFNRLPSQTKDLICSRAVGSSCAGVNWNSAILSRSGFGTARAWGYFGQILPLNPSVLRGAVQRLLAAQGHSVGDFVRAARALVDELHGACVLGWHEESINVFGKELIIPLLDLDQAAIVRLRSELNR